MNKINCQQEKKILKFFLEDDCTIEMLLLFQEAQVICRVFTFKSALEEEHSRVDNNGRFSVVFGAPRKLIRPFSFSFVFVFLFSRQIKFPKSFPLIFHRLDCNAMLPPASESYHHLSIFNIPHHQFSGSIFHVESIN